MEPRVPHPRLLLPVAGLRGKSDPAMADELLPARDETQDDYDRAAWDYLDRLREMTPQQAAAHFKRVEWIKGWEPEPSTFCATCGSYALEMKFSDTHIRWQCLEETCRRDWEWKRR